MVLDDVVIPQYATAGRDITLHCRYTLQGEDLFAVKWYRNTEEFYIYKTKPKPRGLIFNAAGIDVDVSY